MNSINALLQFQINMTNMKRTVPDSEIEKVLRYEERAASKKRSFAQTYEDEALDEDGWCKASVPIPKRTKGPMQKRGPPSLTVDDLIRFQSGEAEEEQDDEAEGQPRRRGKTLHSALDGNRSKPSAAQAEAIPPGAMIIGTTLVRPEDIAVEPMEKWERHALESHKETNEAMFKKLDKMREELEAKQKEAKQQSHKMYGRYASIFAAAGNAQTSSASNTMGLDGNSDLLLRAIQLCSPEGFCAPCVLSELPQFANSNPVYVQFMKLFTNYTTMDTELLCRLVVQFWKESFGEHPVWGKFEFTQHMARMHMEVHMNNANNDMRLCSSLLRSIVIDCRQRGVRVNTNTGERCHDSEAMRQATQTIRLWLPLMRMQLGGAALSGGAGM